MIKRKYLKKDNKRFCTKFNIDIALAERENPAIERDTISSQISIEYVITLYIMYVNKYKYFYKLHDIIYNIFMPKRFSTGFSTISL